MTNSRIRVLLFAVLAVGLAAPTLGAQVKTEQPIRIKAPKKKMEKFRGEVLHASRVQIIVRSRENEKVVRTFTYSPKVKEQMEQLEERGALFQVGDKVEIECEPGSDVALKIKGKPSQPQ